MANVLDCSLEVNVFVPQFRYYFRTNTLGKVLNPLICPNIILIVSQLLFHKDSFGFE